MTHELKVLAVDDNLDNLTVLRALMKEYLPDARVIAAASGSAGLALARSEDPDVALLDISMPGMDGFEVCQKLKADEALSCIPVVFLTAVRTDAGARIRALEVGAEGFLARPVDEFALMAQVRAMAKLKAANVRQRREKEALAELVDARTRELQAQRDQLHDLLFAVPTAIVVFDEQERVVLANPSAAALTGEDAHALIGRAAHDVLRCRSCARPAGPEGPPPSHGLCAAVHEAIAGRSVRDREVELEVASGGGRRQLLCNAEPLAVGGRPGAVLVLRDISELRRVQRSQEQIQATLAQSDRLVNMGLLAASVAHEINNPLSFIMHHVESLAQDLPKIASCWRRCHEGIEGGATPCATASALRQEMVGFGPALVEDALIRLQETQDGNERIRRITRGLSTFSRVEGTAPEPVDVRVSLEHALTLAMNDIRHRARVTRRLEPVSLVLASEGKLAQVLLNLLVNAAHAIEGGQPEANEICVRTTEADGVVCVEVSDTGKGIAPELRERLFEPFVTTKGVGVGSGLGLWISRNIIEELRGELDFESAVGKGTCFRIKLPAMPPSEQGSDEAKAPRSGAPALPAVRGRVLVVDDEPGMRKLLSRVLGHEHEVVAVASGTEAKNLLGDGASFDAVVCDLMMPGITGIELHDWLAQRDPALAARLVFVTGGVFARGAWEYLERVRNLRVEKPFEPERLRALVGGLVRGARSPSL